MSQEKGWVIDKTTDWPFWLERPSHWVGWINGSTGDLSPLTPNNLDEMPIAGIAADNWHFSALVKRGEVVGAVDLAIETNKKDAFYALLETLNWESLAIRKGAGILAGKCLKAISGTKSTTDFMLLAGMELITKGAIAPWTELSTHTIFSALPDRLLKEKIDLVEKPCIPGTDGHRLPLPMALILDADMGKKRDIVFKTWVQNDICSLALARFLDGKSEGGGVLHACVWGGAADHLSYLLKRSRPEDLMMMDKKGRTALHLAIELGSDSCEKDLRSYNGRQVANDVLRHL